MIKNSHHSQASLQKMRHPRGSKRDPLERFNEKIDRNGSTIRPELGPCHIWTGKRRKGQFDYGQFYYKGKIVQAHKFLYEWLNGSLPKGICALHHCDNPPCVREDHLFAGSRRVNAFDMIEKGRHRPGRGERQRDAKLSYEMADTIRWSHRIGGLSIKTLARWYEVGETTIAHVVHDETWVLPKAA